MNGTMHMNFSNKYTSKKEKFMLDYFRVLTDKQQEFITTLVYGITNGLIESVLYKTDDGSDESILRTVKF